MPNLLSIPFKKTYTIDVREPVRNYIYAHGGGHPDEFKEDVALWQHLRKDGVGGLVHIDRIDSSLLYHAQLVAILTKLPSDIGLEIAYAPTFRSDAIPVTLRSLAFERCGTLFNLAALYSQLAAAEDRSVIDGIKRAVAGHQYAAGVLTYLNGSAVPRLVYSPEDDETARDLEPAFLQSLEFLMLAQAQECSWQLAKLNQYKNGLIAKIAARTAALYQSSAQAIRDANPPIKDLFPSDWLPHIEAKAHHFTAVSQIRKSIDEIESSRYGLEIARLRLAQSEAKAAQDIARRGRVAATVQQDIQSVVDAVQKNLTRAERDNDLIYHHDVPAASALPPVTQTNLVTPTMPSGLSDPVGLLKGSKVIFGGLVGWGAKEAINIYNDRKQNLLTEKLVEVAKTLQQAADQALGRLNLPASLEALERPIGLPPSLLRKAGEVRLENGPEKIEQSFEDIERLANRNLSILDEAMDILDGEASEDEAARKTNRLNRLPSYEANVELVEKEKRYRQILVDAAASDEVVRQKWDDWENNIIELTWSEEDLEASIPSTTVSSTTTPTPESRQTHAHARALRVQMEELDDLHRVRDQIVRRAQRLANNDDITERILKVATGFERLVEVEPAMFEDVSDEELAKFDKYLVEMSDVEQRQNNILAEIQRLNELFLQSRRDDPAVKEREHALQSLDLAYHKYREITRNLDEGFKFYNSLTAILLQFKEGCKQWSQYRNQEIHRLSSSLQALSVEDKKAGPSSPDPKGSRSVSSKGTPSSPPMTARSPPKKQSNQPARNSGLSLPPLNSDEWEYDEVQPPPKSLRRT